jgi:hypothetical protein
MDASLGAIERDVHEIWARWYIHIHETLKPTLSERMERAARYAGLLASRNQSTVSFALQALKRIDKSGRLDGELLLDTSAPRCLRGAKARSERPWDCWTASLGKRRLWGSAWQRLPWMRVSTNRPTSTKRLLI